MILAANPHSILFVYNFNSKMSQEMPELKLICKSLDELAVDILKTLQAILFERKNLDLNLKDGYIYLAKSRYLMRGRKVDILQVNTNNLHASRKVFSCSDIAGSTKYLTYSFDSFDVENNKSGLRHRAVGENEIVENLQNVSIDDYKNEYRGSKESLSDSKTEISTDPLKWFGVLVPESLRSCQLNFRQATDCALKLGSLQNKLKALGAEYRKLKEKKENVSHSNKNRTES